jgi:hypothetical protein
MAVLAAEAPPLVWRPPASHAGDFALRQVALFGEHGVEARALDLAARADGERLAVVAAVAFREPVIDGGLAAGDRGSARRERIEAPRLRTG